MSAPAETLISEVLLRLYPEPLLWFLLLIISLIIALIWWRNPASVSAQVIFMVVFTANTYFGGFFNILNMLLMFTAGATLIIGIRRTGHKGDNA